jgi:hypothetical protein
MMMVRIPKRRWVAVNYETGEVLQVSKPMTQHKALKIFTAHQTNLIGFILKPDLKSI